MYLFKQYQRLKKLGILSLNRRNADLIIQLNPRKYIALVDDKLKTKKLAKQSNIQTPDVLAEIAMNADLHQFYALAKQKDEFAIKPANGSAGHGILIITGHYREYFRKSSGELVKLDDMGNHILNILTGIFSLGGYPDVAIIEQLIKAHHFFKNISYQGVPDIRIIVYKNYPIMAMLRLPTRASDGKANLHQGALGVGIDIETGVTLTAVNAQNEIIDFHPDTLHPISNLTIPYWQQCLEIAQNCAQMTKLGYIGVDIVIDEVAGPLMLEINARPGLNIQLANRAGLIPRIQEIDLK